jgi:hypothetical protein
MIIKSNKMDEYLETLPRMFSDIPSPIKRWFLDTNVWGKILRDAKLTQQFISTYQGSNDLLGLTVYSLFEISRVKSLISRLDKLFFDMRHNIWVPLLYDQVFEKEVDRYPNPIDIPWMPMSLLTGEEVGGPSVMSKFSKDSNFLSSRDDHLNFGFARFMSLEKFKKNFGSKDPSGYSPEDAFEFSKLNGIDYFRRYDQSFLRDLEMSSQEFIPSGIRSQFARSIFLFYKYYIHGQSPIKSDFMDFANISYLPYFHNYVTEKNIFNTIRHIQGESEYMDELDVIHITAFLDGLR